MSQENQERIQEREYHNSLCDIVGMKNISNSCLICGKRADFTVTYCNKKLPDGYHKEGESGASYCNDHLPQRAKDRWVFWSNLDNWN